jgi:hypothetical protein
VLDYTGIFTSLPQSDSKKVIKEMVTELFLHVTGHYFIRKLTSLFTHIISSDICNAALAAIPVCHDLECMHVTAMCNN